ncbi:hypothetical protein B9Z55_019950 [Caenorhabditis nigoni]|uniref:Uncharacterized protein n=1 Tax=Caenorhabditis nigoni TaxID=1611254 RepID=A0A2G5TKJ4_9PELO|nr:hypothetical protein B9Z55_019950 [Caenorhabditis nigoni]
MMISTRTVLVALIASYVSSAPTSPISHASTATEKAFTKIPDPKTAGTPEMKTITPQSANNVTESDLSTYSPTETETRVTPVVDYKETTTEGASPPTTPEMKKVSDSTVTDSGTSTNATTKAETAVTPFEEKKVTTTTVVYNPTTVTIKSETASTVTEAPPPTNQPNETETPVTQNVDTKETTTAHPTTAETSTDFGSTVTDSGSSTGAPTEAETVVTPYVDVKETTTPMKASTAGNTKLGILLLVITSISENTVTETSPTEAHTEPETAPTPFVEDVTGTASDLMTSSTDPSIITTTMSSHGVSYLLSALVLLISLVL